MMTPMEAAKYWVKEGNDPGGFALKASGTGVITTKDFEEGDFLLVYKDGVITTDEAKTIEKELKEEFQLLKCKSEWGELCVVSRKSPQSLASCVTSGRDSEVNCELRVIKHSNGYLYLCLFAKSKIESGQELKLKQDKTSVKTSGIEKSTAIAIGAGVAAGVTAIAAAPLVLTAIGFTSAGIAAGSVAAGMMSSAAIANGGGIAAGSLVAVLQSAGAVGISGAVSAAIGSSVAALTGGITKFGLWLGEKKGESKKCTEQRKSDSSNPDGDAKSCGDLKTDKRVK